MANKCGVRGILQFLTLPGVSMDVPWQLIDNHERSLPPVEK